MLFKVDENLPVEVADLLISEGHNAYTVGQQNMQGINDNELIKVCKTEKRILISPSSKTPVGINFTSI
jgi:predicted nuclease of predicted toxin-antitoxin system